MRRHSPKKEWTASGISTRINDSGLVLCPKCKTDNAHRSHRRGLLEMIASVVAFYPNRCHRCKYRFLKFRYSSAEPIVDSATEREIQATRGAIQWKRKRREFLLYGVACLLFAVFLYVITRERGTSAGGN